MKVKTMAMSDLWNVSVNAFDSQQLLASETIFTLGNGYLGTRGAFEEGYPGERRATFIHGVFDDAPIVFTELANAPDWLPLAVYVEGERFSLAAGAVEDYHQALDLRRGVLTRSVRWRSPAGRVARLTFERFASLSDPHALFVRCTVEPEFVGTVEFRAAVCGSMDNEGFAHWDWIAQGPHGETATLHVRTRRTGIDCALALRVAAAGGAELERALWDAQNAPTVALRLAAEPGRALICEKTVCVYTSRDVPATQVVDAAVACAERQGGWDAALAAHTSAWEAEWVRSDVTIEGDAEAQLAIRFNLFQLLIAAPRRDEHVSIGAKTLSGFGYRGHVFWDTETFMLPFFVYTAPDIARNLLAYRYHTLPGARRKAQARGCEGALFAWESAATGDEVTPRFVPHFQDPTRLVRIWPGDIELHIVADVAYAAYTYWHVTGDDAWLTAQGAELILDTAKFWASRAEFNVTAGRYEYRDVIGPDEYHDHVDNNAYTNRLAQWNLEAALAALSWLERHAPERAAALVAELDLTSERLALWHDVIARMYVPAGPAGLIEQFDGYFERRQVDLAALEPRALSMQALLGIEGANEAQPIKQPDVMMLLHLLRGSYPDDVVRANYAYYTPRTDLTYGSSLGPSIQAILACEMGQPEEAYEHFMRAARADLHDVRGNARDGIHGASAGGLWQAAVFGFAGLRVGPDTWSVHPQLPEHWTRLGFKFWYRGEMIEVDLAR
jgi:trehalose/maltose hydrolase-like predicted phosphorylase